jgi:hypothetical protein
MTVAAKNPDDSEDRPHHNRATSRDVVVITSAIVLLCAGFAYLLLWLADDAARTGPAWLMQLVFVLCVLAAICGAVAIFISASLLWHDIQDSRLRAYLRRHFDMLPPQAQEAVLRLDEDVSKAAHRFGYLGFLLADCFLFWPLVNRYLL